jgi:alpha-1,6-mannosyltransferase
MVLSRPQEGRREGRRLARPTAAASALWARCGPPLASAWRLGPVRRGCFGVLAIELGSFTPAYLPQSSPLWAPLRAAHLDGAPVRLIGTVVVLIGIWLLADGWFRLRRTGLRPAEPWAVLALWSLPVLFGPPIFSHDAYSYAAQGWMIHNGVNPYNGGPGVLPGAFADQVAWVWRYTPAPYGPLSLQISHALVDLSGFRPSLAAELMRVPALLGVALIVGCLPQLARRVGAESTWVVWFACLNPFLVIDYVGGAHNDALMMGLIVLALSVACQRPAWIRRLGPVPRPAAVRAVGALNLVLAAGLIGVAAAVKQPAFLTALAVPLLGRCRPPRPTAGPLLRTIGLALASLGLAVAAFAAVTAATGLGYGWLNALGVPGSVTTVSPTTLIGGLFQQLIDPGNRHIVVAVQSVGTVIAFVLVGLLFAVLGWRRPLRALALSYLAAAGLGPALHSWYVLWGALLLPLTAPRRMPALPRIAVAATVVLLSYAAILLAWRNGVWALGVAAALVLIWFAVQHELDDRRRRLAQPSEGTAP